MVIEVRVRVDRENDPLRVVVDFLGLVVSTVRACNG
jgi:hypothetical protein